MNVRILIAAAIISTALTAPAATNESIIITATRIKSELKTVPTNPTIITAQDIEESHYASVPEALQKKAGIFFSNYADNPSQASVNLRGFGGDNPHGKVLVMLNGRKLNRPDQASINWAQVPLQTIERIEVVRGPNTVLYGDHAVSGVINIITKGPTDTPKTTLSASIGSYEKYEQNLTTSGTLNGLGYTAALGHQSGDGYRDRSRYDTLSGSLRLSGDIHDNLSAYAEASAVKEQHQFPGSLSLDQVKEDRRQSVNPADAAREKYYNIQSGANLILTDELLFDLDGGFSRKDIEADLSSWFTYSDNTIDTGTLSPKLTLFAPLAALENELVLGVDLTTETFKLQKYADKARTTQTTDTKVSKNVVGTYIADTLSLTDGLFLNGGFRTEKNKVRARHTDALSLSPYNESQTHTEEAWQISLTWIPTDTLKLFTRIDRTYRYPFIDEQASYWGFGGDFFNKDLKPETGVNYESGIELTPTETVVLQATVFQTDMKDEIAPNASFVNENLDETMHRGIELSASYHTKLFELDSYYTWLQSEFTEGSNDHNEIPWVPRNKLNINLALLLTEALTFNTHLSYTGSMFPLGDNDNNTAEKQSGYVLTDLLLEYTQSVKKSTIGVFAGVDNVFGKEYNFLVTDYGFGTGYYPAPERTYKAGVSIRF